MQNRFPLCHRSSLPHFQNLCITQSSQIPSSEFFLQTFSLLLFNSDKQQGQKAPSKTQKVAVRFNAGRVWAALDSEVREEEESTTHYH